MEAARLEQLEHCPVQLLTAAGEGLGRESRQPLSQRLRLGAEEIRGAPPLGLLRKCAADGRPGCRSTAPRIHSTHAAAQCSPGWV